MTLPPRPSVPEKACRRSARNGVRTVLVAGVFWRILIIEALLLAISLAWRWLYQDADLMDLFRHTFRIAILMVIIIAFVTLSLRRFLNRAIIRPLEAISQANQALDIHAPAANSVDLPGSAPAEIVDIVRTRRQMLEALLKESAERLQLVERIRNTFGRYLSQKVVDQILSSPDGHALGGRRETVTILMADLRGFTKIAESQDAQQTVQFLNRFFEAMTQIIVAHDGMIDEFLGDGILTIFGVPEKHPDDPARAVTCALEMQNRILSLNQEIAAEGYPPLSMGIGINTGTVIVGNIGSELRAKYGIVGKAVNIAGRIESMTPSGQVWISETTYHLLAPNIQVDAPQPLMVKGLSHPLVCYPVKAIHTPYQVTLCTPDNQDTPVEIRLPLTCWVMDDKKIVEPGIDGETIHIAEETMTIALNRTLRPNTHVKLQFNFCTEAHCFDPIYASLVESSPMEDRFILRLRMTDIAANDRDILMRWLEAAA